MAVILWQGQPTTEYATSVVDAHRWVLEVARWSACISLQHRYRDSGEWRSSHTDCWGVWIGRRWHIGSEHVYYDGPHCLFSLGFVQVQYRARGGWCTKCMPD